MPLVASFARLTAVEYEDESRKEEEDASGVRDGSLVELTGFKIKNSG